jgi:diacylglycerol kinase family enzyme
MQMEAKHVLIAANPNSGAASSKRRVSELNDKLNALGFESQIIESLDLLRSTAAQMLDAGTLRTVVSAGGDGTVAALANLLPPHVPLLIFPLGTENLLAKYLGLSNDVRVAAEAVRANGRLAMDVGQANGKLFLVMLSCGFDAEVVRQMHAVRSGHISRWSYTRPILTALREYRFPQLTGRLQMQLAPVQLSESQLQAEETLAERIAADELPPEHIAAWFFVFNVPRYAAGLNFCPQANPTDGALDVCTFQRPGIVAGLGYLSRLWFGSHQRLSGFRHQLCQQLSLPAPLAADGRPLNIPFQIDGDPGGVLPLEVSVLPGRLQLLTPSAAVTSH